jgi:hypothetical protein
MTDADVINLFHTQNPGASHFFQKLREHEQLMEVDHGDKSFGHELLHACRRQSSASRRTLEAQPGRLRCP